MAKLFDMVLRVSVSIFVLRCALVSAQHSGSMSSCRTSLERRLVFASLLGSCSQNFGNETASFANQAANLTSLLDPTKPNFLNMLPDIKAAFNIMVRKQFEAMARAGLNARMCLMEGWRQRCSIENGVGYKHGFFEAMDSFVCAQQGIIVQLRSILPMSLLWNCGKKFTAEEATTRWDALQCQLAHRAETLTHVKRCIVKAVFPNVKNGDFAPLLLTGGFSQFNPAKLSQNQFNAAVSQMCSNPGTSEANREARRNDCTALRVVRGNCGMPLACSYAEVLQKGLCETPPTSGDDVCSWVSHLLQDGEVSPRPSQASSRMPSSPSSPQPGVSSCKLGNDQESTTSLAPLIVHCKGQWAAEGKAIGESTAKLGRLMSLQGKPSLIEQMVESTLLLNTKMLEVFQNLSKASLNARKCLMNGWERRCKNVRSDEKYKFAFIKALKKISCSEKKLRLMLPISQAWYCRASLTEANAKVMWNTLQCQLSNMATTLATETTCMAKSAFPALVGTDFYSQLAGGNAAGFNLEKVADVRHNRSTSQVCKRQDLHKAAPAEDIDCLGVRTVREGCGAGMACDYLQMMRETYCKAGTGLPVEPECEQLETKKTNTEKASTEIATSSAISVFGHKVGLLLPFSAILALKSNA